MSTPEAAVAIAGSIEEVERQSVRIVSKSMGAFCLCFKEKPTP